MPKITVTTTCNGVVTHYTEKEVTTEQLKTALANFDEMQVRKRRRLQELLDRKGPIILTNHSRTSNSAEEIRDSNA